jgi:hypothetical protein
MVVKKYKIGCTTITTVLVADDVGSQIRETATDGRHSKLNDEVKCFCDAGRLQKSEKIGVKQRH